MIVYANGKVKGTDVDGNTSDIRAVGPNSDQLKVADLEVRDLFYDVIRELKKMNIQLANMTDMEIEDYDIEV